MINLKFLNNAIGNVSSDEFAALYFIANTISLQKSNRTKIYREQIADKLGWINSIRPEYGVKKVTKITNQLVKKGYLNKEIVFENPQKSVTYYSLNTQIIDKKDATVKQKNIPLNNIEKEIKIENNNKIEMGENPADGFPPFPIKEHEALLNDCIEQQLSTYECYSTFAKMGQDSFNWLCSQLHESKNFYNGTTHHREKVAKEYQLTIPTFFNGSGEFFRNRVLFSTIGGTSF